MKKLTKILICGISWIGWVNLVVWEGNNLGYPHHPNLYFKTNLIIVATLWFGINAAATIMTLVDEL